MRSSRTEDDPAALCGYDADHRHTGLNERVRWHVRPVTEAPEPPQALAVSKDEDYDGDELVVTFAADEEATHHRMEYTNAGSTQNFTRKWTGKMSPDGQRLVIDDIDYEV